MIKRLVIISIIFSLLAPIIIESAQRCSLCGKPIAGRYVKFDDGEVFCIDCMEKYSRCDICGKPSRSSTKIDGKTICRECILKLDKCDNCKKPIAGKYIKYPDLNLMLCEKCANTMPKCDMCGRPDKNLSAVGHKKVCRSCLKKLSVCYICGEPIEGEYVCFDGDISKKYCRKCVDKYSKCASCGSPVGNKNVKLDDGRILCHDCYKSALFEPAHVKAIKLKTLTYMESYLGMKIQHDIKYSLQGKDYIKKKSEGLSDDLNGLFYRINDTFEIYILYGLRKKDLYQVVPHEIAHAWSAENSRSGLSLEDEEGFAQWVAYHSLGYFGYLDFRETLKEGDNVYASGLRKMLSIERNGGKQAVFNYMTKK